MSRGCSGWFTIVRRFAEFACMTDVSVIVPTFNRPSLLARALESLAAQTLERDRFEVLVVNDCGLEPTDVVAAFADRLDVRLLSTPENGGLAATRNVGIANARGRYVSFLDDDDCFYPEHLQLLVDTADELGGETVVYSDAIHMIEDDEGTPLVRQMIQAPAEFSYERLLLNNYIHAMCPLVPLAALEHAGGFDEELRALEDWELWLRLGRETPFHHVLRATADYRIRRGSINNTTRELPLHVRCTELVYERYPVDADSSLARDRERYLTQHRAIAEQRAIATSVLIANAPDMATLLQTIEQALAAHPSPDTEFVAYVPSDLADEHAALLRTLDESLAGRLVLVRGDERDAAAREAILERKAAGLRVEHAPGDDYCIAGRYQARPVPEYYADEPSGILWQPDVYPEARRIARAVGARTIVDLGSGNGAKLAPMHPEFAIVGVDMGSNLDFVRRHHPQGTWVEHDFEQPGALPLDDELLDGSVVVCADVIEHLMRPEHLLAKLRDAFDRGAAAVLLSTPERVHTWGREHAGPPPNPCHVREWTLEELGALLEREGFEFGDLELTRSNDAENRMATSLAILYRDEHVERVVRELRDAAPTAA